MRGSAALLAAALAACSSSAPPAVDGGPVPTPVGCAGCLVFPEGRFFDGTSMRQGTVVVEGERVLAVVDGPVTVTAGEVVSLAGRTLLPGLFDLHVHLGGSAAPLAAPLREPFYDAHLRAMLRSGVTSFLDLGSSAHTIFALRGRERAGTLLASRVFAAGPLLTATGGHPCRLGTPPGDFCSLVDDLGTAQAAVADLVSFDSDVVKIVLDPGSLRPLPRLRADLIGPLEEAAAAAGVPVVGHVASAQDVADALDAGVTRFAHIPSYDAVSPALAARMAAAGAQVIATLSVITNYHAVAAQELPDLEALADDVPEEVRAALVDPAALGGLTSPEYVAWTLARSEQASANFATLLAAGVELLVGTDAGNPGTFHGLAVKEEIGLFVANGMAVAGALSAATRGAADFLGRADLGRIALGALADLVLVDGDPSAELGALGQVGRVWRGGAELDRHGLRLGGEVDLTLVPTTELATGAACFAASECGAGLTCSPAEARCVATCDTRVGCGAGVACFSFAGTDGFCFAGDGCDLFAQGCVNGTACQFLGQGATLCDFAGTAGDGETCGPGGTCAPGTQCGIFTDRCQQFCHPDAGDCPTGERCVDKSTSAGFPVGLCTPSL